MIEPIIHHFDEVSSTNDIAIEMAGSGAPEGTVVLARSQTKGRGRRGRLWLAKPGENIMLTAIVRPTIPMARYSELAFVAAVAAAELIESCGLRPSLKWPNDVLIGEKKLVGILVEAANGAAVIGIGVNVLQTDLPPEIRDKATSIAIEGGTIKNIDELTDRLVRVLFAIYPLPFKEILDRWRKYMWGVGRPVEVETVGGTVSGIIAGVDYDGALLLKTADGRHRIIVADAIHLLR